MNTPRRILAQLAKLARVIQKPEINVLHRADTHMRQMASRRPFVQGGSQ